MNNYPHLDSDEANIQEAIAQFYSFFGRMVQLRNDIEQLSLEFHTKNRILYQLEDIEKEYKDSQEWFVTRNVQDVRVGVIGTERSLKTAVVSLFVEGVLEIEGDEKDGRSKSKITVDGKCKLLLIREETGAPSKQLSQWADVLVLVFSHSDDDSLAQIGDFYRVFRETSSEAPVLLVGIKDDQVPVRKPVKESDVKKTVEQLDKCAYIDVALSEQGTYTLFTQACRVALNSPVFSHFITNSMSNSCSISTNFPSSPSQSSLSQPAKLSGGMPASPSHSKARSNKRKSMFGGSSKGSYNITKSQLESFGSGRPVPVKEGQINKKSAGGLRAEWKKKYLVLSKTEITYYPTLNDYMSMTHGKTLKLQQITVKVPGQHVSSVSRPTATPPSSEITDSLAVTSQPGHSPDRSNSTSPPPGLESSLDVSYNSSNMSGSGFASLPAYPRVTHASPQHLPPPPLPGHAHYNHSRSHDLQLGHENRDYRSPGSSERDEFGSSDQIEESFPGLRYDGYSNGRGHNRNGSVDDSIMLQQLRTGGISYIPVIEEDRSATMSRIETRKNKKGGGLQMNVLPASSEEMLEGSQESIGRFDRDKKKKGEKGDRYSMLLSSDRTMSESAKDKSSFEKRSKGHKRQRSWGAEALAECCEFQVLSSDNKIWSFDAASAEEAAQWVKAIEDQIKKIISESVSHKRVNSVNDFEKKEIVNMEGNGYCADCNAPNPEWASLNLGCLLCIECSGVHRNLGSHISRIRSLTLDEWSPELISVMLSIGNKLSRNLWEAKKPKSRPLHNATREERERFIKAKYVDKEFLSEVPNTDKPVHLQLMDAVKTNNITGCLNILAHSTPEDINTLHEQPEGWAAMHVACMFGKTVILQLLIWNGGDVNILDADKHPPIFYARQNGHQDAVQILIANSCVDDSSDTGSIDVAQQAVM